MSEILLLDFKNNHSRVPDTRRIGDAGEKLAAGYLIKNGYRLVMANFKIPIGRNSRGVSVTGEIDLIAIEDDVLCFVEVKTRSSDEFASPVAAVNLRKQRQITRTARMYRKTYRLEKIKFRYDVISIILKNGAKPQIEIFKNFWHESKFRKKTWLDDF
jgi:putative endonuclease